MQCANALEATIAIGYVGIAGCTGFKPLQADVADLKSLVGKLQSEVAVTPNSADQANSMAQASGKSAGGARIGARNWSRAGA